MPGTTPFEIWEDHAATVRFCFSYISDTIITGALMIKANFELPQHSYSDCSQNVTQLAGQCTVTTLAPGGEILAASELGPGDWLEVPPNTPCIITNVTDEESVTLFALKGNGRAVVENIRRTYVPIDRSAAQEV